MDKPRCEHGCGPIATFSLDPKRITGPWGASGPGATEGTNANHCTEAEAIAERLRVHNINHHPVAAPQPEPAEDEVERVARAVKPIIDAVGWEAGCNARLSNREIARAAIAAMREPVSAELTCDCTPGTRPYPTAAFVHESSCTASSETPKCEHGETMGHPITVDAGTCFATDGWCPGPVAAPQPEDEGAHAD